MNRKEIIEMKLNSLNPYFLEIIDETSLHKGHINGSQANIESHFRIVIKAKKLEGLSRLQQHRLINHLLKMEFSNTLHALTISIQ